jgi:hypothetical protein
MSLGNSVAAILLLLFMVLISLVSVLNLLYFYISTFRIMCALPNMAVFCSSLASCFLGMLLKFIIIIIIIIIIVIIFKAHKFRCKLGTSLTYFYIVMICLFIGLLLWNEVILFQIR